MRRLSLAAIPLVMAGIVLADPQEAPKRKGPAYMKKGPGGPPFRELVERFNKMSPTERSEALSKLPPERRRMMERRLEEWANSPPEVRRRLEASYARFRELSPEKQREVRELFRRFAETFTPERRLEAMRTVRRLKTADADGRKRITDSAVYSEQFSDEERRLIEKMAAELPDRD